MAIVRMSLWPSSFIYISGIGIKVSFQAVNLARHESTHLLLNCSHPEMWVWISPHFPRWDLGRTAVNSRVKLNQDHAALRWKRTLPGPGYSGNFPREIAACTSLDTWPIKLHPS